MVTLCGCLTFISGAMVAFQVEPASRTADPSFFWIRVNQIGYFLDDPKIAILSSEVPLSGSFSVGGFRQNIGEDQGTWGPFRHNYRLDFTRVRTPGRYRVKFGEVFSPPFTIGSDVYHEVSNKLMTFMRLQRCGYNPVTGKKCHQRDAIDTTTGNRIDLVGGWHDAADHIKHMITTTYCVAALFLAGADKEARYGAALVEKIHPDSDTIYVQIGDDRDHLPPAKLPHEDRTDYGWGSGGPRPAWRATGKPDGPKYQNRSSGLASLAGRAAAAMALAENLKIAKSMYRLARRHPGNAMSVPVRAPYYYGERTFHDDLEWAAIELYIATKERVYLEQAIKYAHLAGESRWMGKQRHGHYEFFPYINLAHWRLYPHVDADTKKTLAAYYRAGLERVQELVIQNPYRLGTPLVWCSNNDVIALATQAVLFERMTGDTRYRTLAAEARDWIFGRNPWGVSMIVGVPATGTAASRPHHLFHKIANILPVGGLVDGPVYKDINDSLKFEAFGYDPYHRFQSEIGVYHDTFSDFSTNEPIIDGTVSLMLLLKLWDQAE
ncbi:MAG: glycoside hydrolase family 9 protein [Planctomycetota bacterium]|nr:MAG: glycoside hydrolase family 9 protein [Planctomycetota bacterium]